MNDLPERIKKFSISVLKLTDSISNDRKGDIIAKQIIRSASSVGANYFEAKAASSKKDYINYFLIALKSCNETIFWIESLIELKLADIPSFKELHRESIQISKILGKSVVTLKKKQ